jgi:osmotically-inducible protein OsmY
MVVDNAIETAAIHQEIVTTQSIGRGGTVRLPDRDISREVIAALEGNSLVPEGKVWVAVSNGWVTLKGQVDRNYERRIVAKTVGGLPCVRGVTLALTLRRRIGVPFNGES